MSAVMFAWTMFFWWHLVDGAGVVVHIPVSDRRLCLCGGIDRCCGKQKPIDEGDGSGGMHGDIWTL